MNKVNARVFIPLTNGGVTVIGICDWDKVAGFRWAESKAKNRRSGYVIARLVARVDRKLKIVEPNIISLHRFIMSFPKDQFVDHIDGDTLNNTRPNLRIVTARQNTINSRKIRNINKIFPSSVFKGVTKRERGITAFESHITVNGKYKYLGRYKLEIDAARSYDKAALKYFGEYARLNFNRSDYI